MAESATRSRVPPRILSRDDVLRLAQLARLELTGDETDRFADQLSDILTYIKQLEAVPLGPPAKAPPAEAPPAEPSLEGSGTAGGKPSVDEPSSGVPPRLAMTSKQVLESAPQTAQGLITVPPVVSRDTLASSAKVASAVDEDPATT